MDFIYTGGAAPPKDGGTAYHELTLLSTPEHNISNHRPDEVAAPGLQLTQVDALTT